MDEYIKNNYLEKNAREMARELKVSTKKVDEALERLEKDGEIKRCNNRIIWKDWQDRYIIKHYLKKRSMDVAYDLGVSQSGYDSRVRKLKDEGLIAEKPRKKRKSDPRDCEPKTSYNTSSKLRGTLYEQLRETVIEKVKIGQRYEIYKRQSMTSDKFDKVLDGNVVGLTDRLIIVRSKNGYCECFQVQDYEGYDYKFKSL